MSALEEIRKRRLSTATRVRLALERLARKAAKWLAVRVLRTGHYLETMGEPETFHNGSYVQCKEDFVLKNYRKSKNSR